MSNHRWLSSLVRARQVQEDAAKQGLARAHHRVDLARNRVRYNEERVDSLARAGAEGSAPAFVAAAAALQAAAATHSAALRLVAEAEGHVDECREDLTTAARARRTAEELNERELVAERKRAVLAAQRDLDEVAARMHRDALAARNNGTSG